MSYSSLNVADDEKAVPDPVRTHCTGIYPDVTKEFLKNEIEEEIKVRLKQAGFDSAVLCRH